MLVLAVSMCNQILHYSELSLEVQGGQDYFRFVEGTCIIALCHSSLYLSLFLSLSLALSLSLSLSLSFSVFIRCIMRDKSTIKAMFASLCANYEGSKKVREAKALVLGHQYELFKMKDDESIEEMY